MAKTQGIKNVQPLRTNEEISMVQYFLRQGKYGTRNALIFLIGINTGLRCSDIIKLKVGTVRENKMPFISEKKTSKKSQINLKGIAKEIDDYIMDQGFKSDDDYLFPSRKTRECIPIYVNGVYKSNENQLLNEKTSSDAITLKYNLNVLKWSIPYRILPLNKEVNKHISVQGFYKVMLEVGSKLNRKDLGTHTMRKTFGYHFYMQTNDIMLVSHILNHSSPSITARYIGITEDEINNNLTNFRLG